MLFSSFLKSSRRWFELHTVGWASRLSTHQDQQRLELGLYCEELLPHRQGFRSQWDPIMMCVYVCVSVSVDQAAGVIHSDFERGFIRAEVMSYDDLIECGSEKAVKDKGLCRSEGKEYVMREGDVVLFRFNV